MDFAHPLSVKAFGIQSANDVPTRDPKCIRVYGKISSATQALESFENDNTQTRVMNEEREAQELQGFTFMRQVDGMKFDSRWQLHKFLFKQRDAQVTSLRFVIDQSYSQEVQIGSI